MAWEPALTSLFSSVNARNHHRLLQWTVCGYRSATVRRLWLGRVADHSSRSARLPWIRPAPSSKVAASCPFPARPPIVWFAGLRIWPGGLANA